ncbi:hypothetical protein OG866_07650 [Streptomyces sp. NBC_00663]|nr:hypothetical protein [Streptomyces sp. NBC_00663]
MRIRDPHIHMRPRTTDDYEDLDTGDNAATGVTHVGSSILRGGE